MTNKTEDKFYFGKSGQPERFATPSVKEQQQIRAASRPPSTAIAQLKRTVAEYKKRADKGERLESDDYWGLKAVLDAAISGDRSGLMSRARGLDTVVREEIPQAIWHWAGGEVLRWSKSGQPERFERRMTSQELGHLRNWISNHARNTDEAVSAMGKMQRIFEDDPEFWEDKGWSAVARAANVLAFSRPGQPDTFDASSLERGAFAEASKSPMLGKLLAAKAMPDGGWRAVQVGSDTLVISFEDADLARDFGRRVASKGYNATSPVATTGRYWNVEVKNG